MEPSPSSRRIYTARLNRVLMFIHSHLSDKLPLDVLAKEACFSPFHFHRLFTALVNETPNIYINRIRLERAANMLMMNPFLTVTDIGLSVGFSSSAAFSRSFKAYFGISPSSWRKTHRDGGASNFKRSDTYDKNLILKLGGLTSSAYSQIAEKVTVKHLPEYHVAYMASEKGYHQDHIQFIWRKICRWANARDLLTKDTPLLGISYDNPEITPYDKCRYYACVVVDKKRASDESVGKMVISGGKYAIYPFRGPAKGIQTAFRVLFAHWLPDSGYQPSNQPCIEYYHPLPDTHPKNDLKLDICLPVEPL